jgi:hypothetical protein
MVPSIVSDLRKRICERCKLKCDKFNSQSLNLTSEEESCPRKLWPNYNKPVSTPVVPTEQTLPSNIQMAKNLGGSILDALKHKTATGVILVSEDIADERLAVCGIVSGSIVENHCPFLNKDKRCFKCGCFMEAKVHVEIESCPIGKW